MQRRYDEKVEVYVDGACENNGRSNARAGIGVWFGHGDERNISRPVVGRATNNTAEIQAAEAAVRTCLENGDRRIHIKTDSEFTKKCMTEWVPGWKSNNWTRSNGEPVKNRADLQRLDRLCEQADVTWEHVRGHSGLEGNEKADYLARQGAQNYRSNN